MVKQKEVELKLQICGASRNPKDSAVILAEINQAAQNKGPQNRTLQNHACSEARQEVIQPVYRCLVAHTQRMEAYYYDTADDRLRQAGLAMRIRREGETWMATVKDNGSSAGGLHERNEWNVVVGGNRPDLSVFANTDIGSRLQKVSGGLELRALFITQFERQSMLLVSASGAKIELALDCGQIIAGSQTEPIWEIELELKEGEPEELLQLGVYLAQKYPLRLESKSKFYRGLLLAGYIKPAKIADTAAGEKADAALTAKIRTGLSTGLKNPELRRQIKDFLLAKLFTVISGQEAFLANAQQPEMLRTFHDHIQEMMAAIDVAEQCLQIQSVKKESAAEEADFQKFLFEAKWMWQQISEEIFAGKKTLEEQLTLNDRKTQNSEDKVRKAAFIDSCRQGKYTAFLLSFWRELVR